jgi:hypothetical protein
LPYQRASKIKYKIIIIIIKKIRENNISVTAREGEIGRERGRGREILTQ